MPDTESIVIKKINDKRAREFVLDLWHHFQEWLKHGGTVPLWLASLEGRLRELAESIEEEK